MSIFNVIPVEEEGMSIITLIVFMFLFTGLCIFLKWLSMKIAQYDSKLEEYNETFHQMNKNFADGRVKFTEISGDIKRTEMVVNRIDNSLADIMKNNVDILKRMLNKQDSQE